MCGRSSLSVTEKELEKAFHASFYSEELEKYNPLPSFNVAPSHVMPIIPSDDIHHFKPHRWGLIPFWAKDEKIGYRMINARRETVCEKNAFKQAMSSRRCLVPMDGYYEWKKVADGKQPFRIISTAQSIFAAAGLWEQWKAPDGTAIRSFTILTCDALPSIKEIHDRMPLLLLPEEYDHWLDVDLSPEEVLASLSGFDDDLLFAYPVSSQVNNVRNNNKSLIEPLNDYGTQLELFPSS